MQSEKSLHKIIEKSDRYMMSAQRRKSAIQQEKEWRIKMFGIRAAEMEENLQHLFRAKT